MAAHTLHNLCVPSRTRRWCRASRQVGLLVLQQRAAGLEARGLPLPGWMQRELFDGLRRLGPDLGYRMPPPVQ